MIRLAEARRIALAALGFDRPRPARADARHIQQAIRRLGLVQLDSVNVLIPAHYLVLFSRLGRYDRSRFDDIVYRSGEFTEQWAHEASIVPVSTWPLLRYRMAGFRVRPYGFDQFLNANAGYVQSVMDQIRAGGSVVAADVPVPEGMERKIPNTWSGTIPRAVLESQFARGVLAIADRRPGFVRAYDLAERVIATEHRELMIDRADAERELIRLASRAYGIATADDLADYYRMPGRDARQRITELLEAEELEQVEVEGWSVPAFLHPESRIPKKIEAASILSPFDPVVWYRRRASRLFQFEYRIEIYTPAAKRKFGYYVLPFLLGDRLVARADLKADRKQGRLVVHSTHLETGVRARDVETPLRTELETLAGWLGLDSITGA